MRIWEIVNSCMSKNNQICDLHEDLNDVTIGYVFLVNKYPHSFVINMFNGIQLHVIIVQTKKTLSIWK